MENLETRSPHEFDDAETDDADEWRAGFSMAIMRAETDDSDQLTLDACFTIGTPRGSGAALSGAAAALLCPAMEEVVEEGGSGGAPSVALGVHSPGATVAAPGRALVEEDPHLTRRGRCPSLRERVPAAIASAATVPKWGLHISAR